MRIFLITLLSALMVLSARAQFRYETSVYGGYPFMFTGNNKRSKAAPTIRGMVSYQAGQASLLPYCSIGTSAMLLPLQSKLTNQLSQSVLATSFMLGMNRQLGYREEQQTEWHAGGGIGLVLLRPLSAALHVNGQESQLGYTNLMGKPWFPKAEGNLRCIYFPTRDDLFYVGAMVITEVFWLRDTKTRYTTAIAGTTYNLNFNSLILMPSLGFIAGLRF